MARNRKTLQRHLAGNSDANVAFRDIRALLKALGFEERIRGDHYIFARKEIPEIINLQPRGAMAKPYQVKQIRELVVRHGLTEAI